MISFQLLVIIFFQLIKNSLSPVILPAFQVAFHRKLLYVMTKKNIFEKIVEINFFCVSYYDFNT